MMKEPRTLETFVFFFFLIFLLDQHQSVIESVADFYPPPPQQFLFPAPFQNGKKIGGEAWLSSEEGESTWKHVHFWRILYKLGINKVKME